MEYTRNPKVRLSERRHWNEYEGAIENIVGVTVKLMSSGVTVNVNVGIPFQPISASSVKRVVDSLTHVTQNS